MRGQLITDQSAFGKTEWKRLIFYGPQPLVPKLTYSLLLVEDEGRFHPTRTSRRHKEYIIKLTFSKRAFKILRVHPSITDDCVLNVVSTEQWRTKGYTS